MLKKYTLTTLCALALALPAAAQGAKVKHQPGEVLNGLVNVYSNSVTNPIPYGAHPNYVFGTTYLFPQNPNRAQSPTSFGNAAANDPNSNGYFEGKNSYPTNYNKPVPAKAPAPSRPRD